MNSHRLTRFRWEFIRWGGTACCAGRVQPTRRTRGDFPRGDAIYCVPAWERQCQPAGARLTQAVGPLYQAICSLDCRHPAVSTSSQQAAFSIHLYVIEYNISYGCRFDKEQRYSMSTETITIAVDPRAAQAFHALSDAEQRKLGILLSLRVLEVTETNETLEELMRRISRNARARGLTPEMLEELLHDDE
jgi:hypothetical protein